MNTEDLNKHQSKDLATKTSNWFSLDCEADQETLTLSLNTNINQCVASLQATGINYIERNQSPKDLNFEIGIIDTKDATKNPSQILHPTTCAPLLERENSGFSV